MQPGGTSKEEAYSTNPFSGILSIFGNPSGSGDPEENSQEILAILPQSLGSVSLFPAMGTTPAKLFGVPKLFKHLARAQAPTGACCYSL